ELRHAQKTSTSSATPAYRSVVEVETRASGCETRPAHVGITALVRLSAVTDARTAGHRAGTGARGHGLELLVQSPYGRPPRRGRVLHDRSRPQAASVVMTRRAWRAIESVDGQLDTNA